MTKPPLIAALALSLVGCADDAKQPDSLVLPGDAYYPESLSAGADGTLYVGSLTTGEVTAFADGDTTPRVVIAAGQDGVTGETGVLVHGDTLWLCSIDTTFQRPTEIRSFDLHGQALARYPLAANQFCNDLAFDGAGNLYATDSFSGAIVELAAGRDGVETFVQDPRFAAIAQGAFGLDGIAYDGAGALYVDTLDTGGLYRVALATGEITEIATSTPLAGPDGLRVVDAHTLLVIEGGAGKLTKLAVTGDAATAITLASDLDQPTGVVVARASAWVSQGQLGRLFASPPQAPNLPFAVKRVGL
jgi:outer membrane protein assembly factor BamB